MQSTQRRSHHSETVKHKVRECWHHVCKTKYLYFQMNVCMIPLKKILQPLHESSDKSQAGFRGYTRFSSEHLKLLGQNLCCLEAFAVLLLLARKPQFYYHHKDTNFIIFSNVYLYSLLLQKSIHIPSVMIKILLTQLISPTHCFLCRSGGKTCRYGCSE